MKLLIAVALTVFSTYGIASDSYFHSSMNEHGIKHDSTSRLIKANYYNPNPPPPPANLVWKVSSYGRIWEVSNCTLWEVRPTGKSCSKKGELKTITGIINGNTKCRYRMETYKCSVK